MTLDIPSILDIAIGIAFILLLLSLIVSAVNEVIAKVLSWRSEVLKEGIGNLLDDPDARALAGLVYQHPLVRSLGRLDRKSGEVAKPSYIPSDRFAQALTESIKGLVSSQDLRVGVTRDGVVQQRGGGLTRPAGADQRAPALAQPALAARHSAGDIASFRRLGEAADDIRTLLDSLPDSAAKQSLLALADRSQGRLDEFEKHVAEWFDDGMDRVSGWYKRKVQKVMFGIGLLLVVLLNANVLHIASALSTQPQMRAAVVAQAVEFRSAPSDSQGTMNEDQVADRVLQNVRKLEEELALPLGWDVEKVIELTRGHATSEDWRELLKQIPPTIAGWLITAIAVALGAPFWFNVFNQLLDIRGAGSRRALSPALTGSGGADTRGAGRDPVTERG